MIIIKCPNCSAKYRAEQALLDSCGGFLRCGKCALKFNYYDHFSSLAEDISEFSHDDKDEDSVFTISAAADSVVLEDGANIVFNRHADDEGGDGGGADADDEGGADADDGATPAAHLNEEEVNLTFNPFLEVEMTESPDEFLWKSSKGSKTGKASKSRKAGKTGAQSRLAKKSSQAAEPASLAEQTALESKLNILNDVPEERETSRSLVLLGAGIKHVIGFLFWLLIVGGLMGVLGYQFKPHLSTDIQQRLGDSFAAVYLCQYFSCGQESEAEATFEVVVSRMDLFLTSSEPLNISLFILNRLEESRPYPIIKLSLKNLQGATVGQRYYKPVDYLANASARITAGNIGEVVLKLNNPPEQAVGFVVGLL